MMIILAVGYLVGLVVFILGFRTYRKFRLLADTPESPVRSLAMGLVHIRGKAIGDDRLVSPLTNVPCYYYKLFVEKLVEITNEKNETSEQWQTERQVTDQRAFYVQDATSKVLVNPNKAEFDVLRSFQGQIQGGAVFQFRIGGPNFQVAPSLGVPGPTEDDLRTYLMTGTIAAAKALADSGIPGGGIMASAMVAEQKMESMGFSVGDLGGARQYRFTEWCLPADAECNILGTCAENPGAKDDRDRNVIMRGTNEKMFLISTAAGDKAESHLKTRAVVLIALGIALIVGVTAFVLHRAKLL